VPIVYFHSFTKESKFIENILHLRYTLIVDIHTLEIRISGDKNSDILEHREWYR